MERPDFGTRAISAFEIRSGRATLVNYEVVCRIKAITRAEVILFVHYD